MSDEHVATAAIRDGGWWLTIEGTDISRRLWSDGDRWYGNFPGQALGHHLIREGFMPDRSAADPKNYTSPADKLAAMTLAGWQPVGKGQWTIPCTKLC